MIYILFISARIWTDGSFSSDPELCNLILEDTIYHESVIREAAAEGLAAILDEYADQVDDVLKKLFDMYQDKLHVSFQFWLNCVPCSIITM